MKQCGDLQLRYGKIGQIYIQTDHFNIFMEHSILSYQESLRFEIIDLIYSQFRLFNIIILLDSYRNIVIGFNLIYQLFLILISKQPNFIYQQDNLQRIWMAKDILISIMSLLIVGSCSRVTQGLVQHLASQKTYEKITILDLLPVYDFHYRFYRLQKQLASQQSQTKVGINKLYQLGEFAAAIKQHRDLLFVTHDYFESVTSKTKLMEVTANLSGQRNIVFASPLEYDHFGLADPVGAFQQARQKVIKANPNATFVRSDIQDSTEFLAYLHGPKSLIQEKLFKVPESFHPNIASSAEFNEAVASALKGGSKGETHLINGQAQDALSAPYNRDVHPDEFNHHTSNVESIFKKYRAMPKKESKSA